jgi:hypothetical protein
MRMSFFTPEKTVGSTNHPLPHSGRVAGPPPISSSAPSFFATSI